MAIYKVWLKVKDSAGKEKELDAGTLNVDFALTQEELAQLEKSLPLDEYLKKADINTELDSYATDIEVEEAVKNTVKYGDFQLKAEEVGD